MKQGVELLNWARAEIDSFRVYLPESEVDRAAAAVAKAYLVGANDALREEIDRIQRDAVENNRIQAERDAQFSKAVHGGR